MKQKFLKEKKTAFRIMQQTYTREFQCVFQLMKYPFDTQVSLELLAAYTFLQGVFN